MLIGITKPRITAVIAATVSTQRKMGRRAAVGPGTADVLVRAPEVIPADVLAATVAHVDQPDESLGVDAELHVARAARDHHHLRSTRRFPTRRRVTRRRDESDPVS